MSPELDKIVNQLCNLPKVVLDAATRDKPLRDELRSIVSSLSEWLNGLEPVAGTGATHASVEETERESSPATLPLHSPPAPTLKVVPAPAMRGPKVVTTLTLGNATM